MMSGLFGSVVCPQHEMEKVSTERAAEIEASFGGTFIEEAVILECKHCLGIVIDSKEVAKVVYRVKSIGPASSWSARK